MRTFTVWSLPVVFAGIAVATRLEELTSNGQRRGFQAKHASERTNRIGYGAHDHESGSSRKREKWRAN